MEHSKFIFPFFLGTLVGCVFLALMKGSGAFFIEASAGAFALMLSVAACEFIGKYKIVEKESCDT